VRKAAGNGITRSSDHARIVRLRTVGQRHNL